jgi:hypothetical protein
MKENPKGNMRSQGRFGFTTAGDEVWGGRKEAEENKTIAKRRQIGESIKNWHYQKYSKKHGKQRKENLTKQIETKWEFKSYKEEK